MNYEINASFARVDHILPFLHITTLVFLVAVQISLILTTNFFIKKSYKINDEFFRCAKFVIMILFGLLFTMILTGFLLSNGSDFKFSDPMVEGIITTKYALCFLIMCNLSYIVYRFYLAKKAYISGENDEMIEHIIIAVRYFVVLDVILLFIGVYLGVVMGRFGW